MNVDGLFRSARQALNGCGRLRLVVQSRALLRLSTEGTLGTSAGLVVAGLAWAVSLVGWAGAEQFFPEQGWQAQPDPLASRYADIGGEVVDYAGQSPKSLNYYLDNNVFTARVFSSLYETLIEMNPMTLKYEPYLAERWSISDDKKEFTFWLDADARWSDGRQVTAEDVLWTYDTVMDPKHMTGVHKVSLERLERPEVRDERTIVFRAKRVHWQNLGAAGGFQVLAKHAFEGRDFNQVNFEFPVVSGPYGIGELKEGVYLTLFRRDDWWRRDAPNTKGTGNFQTVKYRFFADRENAFEAFRKGLIDVFAVYTARLWVNGTQGEKFQKNWIVRQRVFNHHPIGFQGFAMNMRRAPFNDLRVRKAMAHLVDRRKMNRALMYDQYFMHRSYYEDLYSDEHPCANELVEFDTEQARSLLAEAGWQVNPKTGWLEKGTTRFTFRFLTRAASSEKFLAIFAEDLRDLGIELAIDKKDWAAWAKDMDEFNYDMTWAAWGAGLFKDPEPMWSSAEADRKGGNNITGFKDARVDALIEEQKPIFDVAQRHAICREIDHLVYEQHPYALLWNINYVRLLYWNKFGTPDAVLSKYGAESTAYWWWDADLAAELEDAMRTGRSLPRKPLDVVYDDVPQALQYPAEPVQLQTPRSTGGDAAPDRTGGPGPEADGVNAAIGDMDPAPGSTTSRCVRGVCWGGGVVLVALLAFGVVRVRRQLERQAEQSDS